MRRRKPHCLKRGIVDNVVVGKEAVREMKENRIIKKVKKREKRKGEMCREEKRGSKERRQDQARRSRK